MTAVPGWAWAATLAVLAALIAADLVLTRDLFVVFTSNAFAVLAAVAGGAVAASLWRDRARGLVRT